MISMQKRSLVLFNKPNEQGRIVLKHNENPQNDKEQDFYERYKRIAGELIWSKCVLNTPGILS